MVLGGNCRIGGPETKLRHYQSAQLFDTNRGNRHNVRFRSEGFPSGQRDQTVNLTALPSKVRILPPPPVQNGAPEELGCIIAPHSAHCEDEKKTSHFKEVESLDLPHAIK